MTTRRESYIQGVIVALSALPALAGRVERSISKAFTREESPVIVVHRGAESLENTLGSDTDRSCEILVSVVSRSHIPDVDADGVMEVAHPVIMAFQSAGILWMEELGTNAPIFSNTDSQACLLTTRYMVHYGTDRLSLSA